MPNQRGPDIPEKDRRTARINLRLDPQISEKIRQGAIDRRMTLAELIEAAVLDYLAQTDVAPKSGQFER